MVTYSIIQVRGRLVGTDPPTHKHTHRCTELDKITDLFGQVYKELLEVRAPPSRSRWTVSLSSFLLPLEFQTRRG